MSPALEIHTFIVSHLYIFFVLNSSVCFFLALKIIGIGIGIHTHKVRNLRLTYLQGLDVPSSLSCHELVKDP